MLRLVGVGGSGERSGGRVRTGWQNSIREPFIHCPTWPPTYPPTHSPGAEGSAAQRVPSQPSTLELRNQESGIGTVSTPILSGCVMWHTVWACVCCVLCGAQYVTGVPVEQSGVVLVEDRWPRRHRHARFHGVVIERTILVPKQCEDVVNSVKVLVMYGFFKCHLQMSLY